MTVRWLMLVRHAKSSWKEPLPDLERPLNKRGLRDAPRMAGRAEAMLANAARSANLLLTSPAVRARETARMFAERLQASDRLGTDDSLYHADAQAIVQRVAELPESALTVLLFGHNPGLADSVEALCGEPLAHLPTAGLVLLSGASEGWPGFASGACRLELFDYPKRLAA